ncbi:MAG TPA: hypothetical protein VMK65_04460 [Longimicrobiales bacterium]|nr:hypothetical protein [Longimicrobiales bacterium]
MRRFTDAEGRGWTATVREEETPRHHGRWYLVLEAEVGGDALPMPEVRWQTRESAERTIATMSEHELRRRAGWLSRRCGAPAREGASPA